MPILAAVLAISVLLVICWSWQYESWSLPTIDRADGYLVGAVRVWIPAFRSSHNQAI
jgi:hypothetical protein